MWILWSAVIYWDVISSLVKLAEIGGNIFIDWLGFHPGQVASTVIPKCCLLCEWVQDFNNVFYSKCVRACKQYNAAAGANLESFEYCLQT